MYVHNINNYPLATANPYIELARSTCTYIIPDLHANPLLLLQHLLRTKIMQWGNQGESYWQRIVDLVNEPPPFDADQKQFRHYLKKFECDFYELLNSAKYDTKHQLLLLGDIIGDRGPNDWFMLLILKVLKKHKVPVSINFSNHDYETYLWAMHNHFAEDKLAGVINDGQRHSLICFHECYRRASKTLRRQMRVTYVNCYLRYVKLFNFHYDKPTNTLSIATHAPGSINLITDIAAELDLTNPDISSPHKLMRLLKKLNKQIHTFMMNDADYFIRHLCPPAGGVSSEAQYPPIVRAIWGRQFELTQERHAPALDYKIKWICGHLGVAIDSNLVTNLDISNLGKGNEPSGQLCYAIDW